MNCCASLVNYFMMMIMMMMMMTLQARRKTARHGGEGDEERPGNVGRRYDRNRMEIDEGVGRLKHSFLSHEASRS